MTNLLMQVAEWQRGRPLTREVTIKQPGGREVQIWQAGGDEAETAVIEIEQTTILGHTRLVAMHLDPRPFDKVMRDLRRKTKSARLKGEGIC